MKKQQELSKTLGQGESIPHLTGEVKFYKTNKKIKNATPYAAIKSAYACYAIYPERKEMIAYSSLIKVEGTVEFYGSKPNVVEGDAFIWPDPQPGVANMELMLKWLVRAFDVFVLYGRPDRLIRDSSLPQSIMFGMANDRRTTLGVVDVANMLINEVDQNTTEAEIRNRLKELTKRRILTLRSRNSVANPNTRGTNVVLDESGRSSHSSSPARYSRGELGQEQYGLNSAAGSTPSLYRQMRPTSMIETGSRGDAAPDKKFNRMSHQPLSTPQNGLYSNGFPSAALDKSDEDDEDLFAAPIRPSHEPPTDVPTTPSMERAPGEKPANAPQTNGVPPQRRISNGTLMAMLAQSQANQQPQQPQETQQDGYFPPQIVSPKQPEAPIKPLTLATPLVPGGHRRALYTPPLLDQFTGSPTSGSSTTSPTLVEPIRVYNTAADNGVLPSPKPMRPSESFHVVEDVEEAAKRASVSPPPLPQLPASLDDNFTQDLEYDLFAWSKKPMPTQQPSNEHLTPPGSVKASVSTNDEQVQYEQHGEKTPLATKIAQSASTPSNESRQKIEDDSPEEEDKELMQMIRNVAQLQRVPTNSDAASVRTYTTVTSDDYASTIDSNEGKPPARREIAPRFGTMKTVGTLPPLAPPPAEVVIGDAHFRPGSAEKQTAQGPPVEIPKVDFGKTVSHVRTLSAETIGPSYTQGNANRVSSYANMHGFGNEVQGKTSPGALDKRSSTTSSWNVSSENQRRSPGPGMLNPSKRNSSYGMLDASKRNSSYGPTTSQEVRNGLLGRPKDTNQRKPSNDSSGGNQAGSSNSSDSASQQNRRSMAWAPGLVKPPAPRSEVDRTQAAEQYVKDLSAEAQAQTRLRYRRVSSNAFATQSTASQQGSAAPVPYSQPPPRPRSRGGNAAFTPNGLVSQAQDISSHLSAREQEFIAKQTGSTLLQINTQKQPPHQAGLLGLLETREGERERMKKATWNGGVDPNILNNATLDHALAQREQQQRQTLIQERERMVEQQRSVQQQQRMSMMSQQDLFARGGTPGPAVDPRQSTLLGARVASPDPMAQMQYSHQSTYQPQHVTQYQQYHQAQQRSSMYGAPAQPQRQSMLPGQYQAMLQEQHTQLQLQQQQFQLNQMQQQLLQQQLQAAVVPAPMQNQMVNMSTQQIGYQPGYQPVQTPQPYGYLPPQSPPPQQQYSQYGGR